MKNTDSHIYLYSLAILISLTIVAPAAIIDVPDDYSTIQRGITEANEYDTVLVQPGAFGEHIDFLGKEIVVASLYLITGDTSFISLTAITGDNERTSVVNFTGGETSAARLIGFTIINYPGGLDGGIYCEYSNPTIARNRIVNNRSMRSGAGIHCIGSSPVIIENLLSGNSAGYLTGSGNGGGIYCDSESNPVIENNIISGNMAFGGGAIACTNGSDPLVINNRITGNAADFGGGICLYSNSNAQIYQNIIRANSVDWWGGGIYCNQASPLLEYNIIDHNISLKEAGGIMMHGSNSHLNNNTISGNAAGDSAGGVWISQSNLTLVNDIVWGNSGSWYDELFISGAMPAITYCDIAGGWEGEGNINGDPLFVDPENSDFDLGQGSPCIDSGDPDFPLDPDSTRCDIGACYHEHGLVIDDNSPLPSDNYLLRNYPNPFNSSTTIVLTLPNPGRARLAIFDINGRLVESVLDEFRPSGIHRFEWTADDLASGVYFIRFKTDDCLKTTRMILLK